jgi:hypothetical protein
MSKRIYIAQTFFVHAQRLHIADLPNNITAVQAIALEQNLIACQFWQQIELRKHQIAHFRGRASAPVPNN